MFKFIFLFAIILLVGMTTINVNLAIIIRISSCENMINIIDISKLS